MTKPEPYGVGACDDCRHNALLVQYGKTIICRNCTSRRLKAALGDKNIPAVMPRIKLDKEQKSPERCTGCGMRERNGSHYPGHYPPAYLCGICEREILGRVGMQKTPIEHDEIAA